jgi:hypothetical protein
VTEVLDQLLQNTGITYKVLNNKLVVLKEASDPINIEDSKMFELQAVSLLLKLVMGWSEFLFL